MQNSTSLISLKERNLLKITCLNPPYLIKFFNKLPIELYSIYLTVFMYTMSLHQKIVSVSQAAALCDVGRTTVGYWIRTKKLCAQRVGKKYAIFVQDLLFFLKSSGQKIPAQLQNENSRGPVFKSFQNCWHYWQDKAHGQNCEQCIAYKNRLQICFSARNSGSLGCLRQCETCQYYQDTFYPRLQFIHQFDIAAAVVKDLYFWAGNRKLADLCEIEEIDLVGMGVEQVVHPSSLEGVISGAKKKALGDPRIPQECTINIKNSQSGALEVNLSVFLLKEPKGAFLVLAEPLQNSQTPKEHSSSTAV